MGGNKPDPGMDEFEELKWRIGKTVISPIDLFPFLLLIISLLPVLPIRDDVSFLFYCPL